jgi:hypothetical protein
MYVVLSTAVLLLLSVAFAVHQQKKIKVSVIAREEVNEKDFFAVRVESEDFLFVRDEMKDVTFIKSLDDVDEFSIKNLAAEADEEITTKNNIKVSEHENVISLKTSDNGDKLVMPKNEKKAS